MEFLSDWLGGRQRRLEYESEELLFLYILRTQHASVWREALRRGCVVVAPRSASLNAERAVSGFEAGAHVLVPRGAVDGRGGGDGGSFVPLCGDARSDVSVVGVDGVIQVRFHSRPLRARVPEKGSTLREGVERAIARPNTRRRERTPTEIGASDVGTFSPFPSPADVAPRPRPTPSRRGRPAGTALDRAPCVAQVADARPDGGLEAISPSLEAATFAMWRRCRDGLLAAGAGRALGVDGETAAPRRADTGYLICTQITAEAHADAERTYERRLRLRDAGAPAPAPPELATDDLIDLIVHLLVHRRPSADAAGPGAAAAQLGGGWRLRGGSSAPPARGPGPRRRSRTATRRPCRAAPRPSRCHATPRRNLPTDLKYVQMFHFVEVSTSALPGQT
ncbi:hypothetical protein SO694_00024344 [Aureococcus anophagefferens]|uniref:Uncharacterized protein n=1 Tax=Aureococcus anophagefferens TaxID=44056 RepID=A0ABR1FUZ7_AURAN